MFHNFLVKGGAVVSPFLMLILRLFFGVMFFFAGLGKFQNAEAVAEFFNNLAIPMPALMVYVVGSIELFGGLALAIGFVSRFTGLILSIIMISAYLTAHHESISMLLIEPMMFVKEPPFNYLLTSLLVFCFGPGLFSVDALMDRFFYEKS